MLTASIGKKSPGASRAATEQYPFLRMLGAGTPALQPLKTKIDDPELVNFEQSYALPGPTIP